MSIHKIIIIEQKQLSAIRNFRDDVLSCAHVDGHNIILRILTTIYTVYLHFNANTTFYCYHMTHVFFKLLILTYNIVQSRSKIKFTYYEISAKLKLCDYKRSKVKKCE